MREGRGLTSEAIMDEEDVDMMWVVLWWWDGGGNANPGRWIYTYFYREEDARAFARGPHGGIVAPPRHHD